MCSLETATRQLNFEEFLSRNETEYPRARTWKRKKGRQLDFGVEDRSVLLNCPDLLPDQTDWPKQLDRIIFTSDQKTQLEALFRKNKFPDRKQRAALAASINVPLEKITTWFSNRRQKWRKEQRKGRVGPSGIRPILPASLLIQSSYKRTFHGSSRITEYPVHRLVPLEKFPSQSYPMNVPLLPASKLQLPCQRVYQPLLPTQYTNFSETNQQLSVPSWFPTYPSVSAEHPVPEQSEFHPNFGADPDRLAEEYPFSYSISKELPHIFGNVDEDEVLERPLTPSFEPTNNFEFADFVQPSAYDSCYYGNSTDFSCGFVSKGGNCNFYRQE